MRKSLYTPLIIDIIKQFFNVVLLKYKTVNNKYFHSNQHIQSLKTKLFI